MKHFSHSHPLELSEIEESDGIICSCCEQDLSGEAYMCMKSKCQFLLHKSCFEFPRKIKHKSHPEHQLTLYPKSPSQFSYLFGCNACGDKYNSFVYCCSECCIDLHPKCAFLPDTVIREDHQHPLQLYYSSPYPEKNYATFVCDICTEIAYNIWVYYCPECDYGTHLECVNAPAPEKEPSEEEEEEEEEKYEDAGEGSENKNEEEGEQSEDAGEGSENKNEEEPEDSEDADINDLRILQIKQMDHMAKLQFQMQMNYLNARTTAMLFRTRI